MQGFSKGTDIIRFVGENPHPGVPSEDKLEWGWKGGHEASQVARGIFQKGNGKPQAGCWGWKYQGGSRTDEK